MSAVGLYLKFESVFHSTENVPRTFSGDARHRRLDDPDVCSVVVECDYVKTHSNIGAKKSVPSPYANAFGFAPAVA